jgi:hypothetical protein
MVRSQPSGPGGPEHIYRPGLVSAGSGRGMIAIVRFFSARKQFLVSHRYEGGSE